MLTHFFQNLSLTLPHVFHRHTLIIFNMSICFLIPCSCILTSDSNNAHVVPTVPGNKIRQALCSAEDNYCRVDMETNCRLEHGPGLRLDYLLLPLHDNILQYDYKRDDSSTRPLATPSRFSITLPNELLPYTEYKVIMFPANDAGRNHSLEHSEVITTAPAGTVLCLMCRA